MSDEEGGEQQVDPMVEVEALPDGKLKDALVAVYARRAEVVKLDAAVSSAAELALVTRALAARSSLTACGLPCGRMPTLFL